VISGNAWIRVAYDVNCDLMIKASKAGYRAMHKRYIREERRLNAEECRLHHILTESGAL
jgi:hypothetical protein